MELFGIVAAVFTGAILAFYRERKSRKKIEHFQSYTNEMKLLNRRLSCLVESNPQCVEKSVCEAKNLGKRIDQLAIDKLIAAYPQEFEKSPYKHQGFFDKPCKKDTNERVGYSMEGFDQREYA